MSKKNTNKCHEEIQPSPSEIIEGEDILLQLLKILHETVQENPELKINIYSQMERILKDEK